VATHKKVHSGVVAGEGSRGSNGRQVQRPRGVNKQVVCVSVVDTDYLTVAQPRPCQSTGEAAGSRKEQRDSVSLADIM